MKYILLLLAAFSICNINAQDTASYSRTEIIYGRKDGMALTMLKLSPKQSANGKAIIELVSGNWVSSYRGIDIRVKNASTYLKRGYTVFLVMHGSQPRYTIPEELNDIKRSVRFIRYNAKEYRIDSNHIAITGYSSGGNLSLLAALTEDVKDASSKDPVDQVSARVQAVGVFFPPTDFLNFGTTNLTTVRNKQLLASIGVAGAFDFKVLDPATRTYIAVNDSTAFAIAKQVSPIYAVSSDDPPTLIIHGDADRLVPLQQSKSIIQKLDEAKVVNELVIVNGKGHGWEDMSAERTKIADWFDKYLK
jgi:acetyl esterase/lipase